MDELLNPYVGTDLYRLAPGLVFRDRLLASGLASGDALVWVLPASVLRGVSAAWAVPVVRAPVSGLYLAYRFGDGDQATPTG